LACLTLVPAFSGQVSKLDTLAGLAIKYNITVRCCSSWCVLVSDGRLHLLERSMPAGVLVVYQPLKSPYGIFLRLSRFG
jgi:hypothetical protein